VARGQLLLTLAMDGRIVCCGIISPRQPPATSVTVKRFWCNKRYSMLPDIYLYLYLHEVRLLYVCGRLGATWRDIWWCGPLRRVLRPRWSHSEENSLWTILRQSRQHQRD